MKNKIDYNAIQKEIEQKKRAINDGDMDVYDFCGYISKKYFKPVDPMWGERTDVNPYSDLLFAMLEINDVELY